MSKKHRWPHHLRAFAFLTIGLLLIWQILTKSLVAYLADKSPEIALALRSDDATALLNIADRQFARELEQKLERPIDQTGGESVEIELSSPTSEPNIGDRIEASAKAVLVEDPLNAHALWLLGQIATTGPQSDKVEPLMTAAAHRSLQESGAVVWLMYHWFKQQDYKKSAYYADVLFRTRPQFAEYIVPTLAAIAENKNSRDVIMKLLAKNPRWRQTFLSSLPSHITKAHTPFNLFFNLKDTTFPPKTAELRSYLNFLIGKQHYDLAYYTWLQFLPQKHLENVRLLFNGSFENEPMSVPFDWNIFRHNSKGVSLEISRHPDQDGQRALLIKFEHGRVQFPHVAQMTMLAPGRYKLEGQYKGQIIGRRGLIWRIRCVGGKRKLLGEAPMFVGVTRNWKNFEAAFSVPNKNCRAQQVRLQFDARSASEQLVTGTAWYDDLVISRASDALQVKQDQP